GHAQFDKFTSDAPAAARANQVQQARFSDVDVDGSDAVHRITSIDAEVEKNLLQLDAVSNHRRDLVEHHLKLEGGGHGRPDQRARFGDELGHRGGLSLSTPPTAEGEELLDEVPCALRRRLCSLEVVSELRVPDGFRALAGEHDVAEHPREDVIEVMRDSGGHGTDCLHLLRLPQLHFELQALLLGGFLLRDVARDDDHMRRATVANGDGSRLDWELLAIVADGGHLELTRLAG